MTVLKHADRRAVAEVAAQLKAAEDALARAATAGALVAAEAERVATMARKVRDLRGRIEARDRMALPPAPWAVS